MKTNAALRSLSLSLVLAAQSNILAFTAPAIRSSAPATAASSQLFSSTANADFAKAVPATGEPLTRNGKVDPNKYNVDLEKAAELLTVSVSADNNLDRVANKPYLDVTSKDYFVDNECVVITRTPESPGLGLDLLELAGGRDDGVGLTIIQGVSGNAEAAGVLPGDSISSVEFQQVKTSSSTSSGLSVEETIQGEVLECDCKDFDSTFEVLTSIPPVDEIESITLNLKRVRRWPRITTVVEYPPSQVAPGADNTETFELFAGENLKRALLNRGIVMEDPTGRKCDFCGGKCSVKVEQGLQLLSPMSTTEEKLMAKNPKCRVSCKTVIGYNTQEGNLRVKVNLNEWTRKDKESSNPFFSK